MAGKNLGTGTITIVGTVTGFLVTSPSHVTTIPASTGGWAMGGAGVVVSTLPTSALIPATPGDAQPGYLLGGEGNPVSTIPQVDEIAVEEVPFLFCGPGVSGHAATSEPSLDALVPEGGFVMGGAGVWGQVAPADLPSVVLVPTGGYVLGGSGFSLDPAVTPTDTVLVGTGGWEMGGRRADPVEVTYPGLVDRTIDDPVGFEMGGEGVWGQNLPAATVIVSNGAVFLMGGAGQTTTKPPPITVIANDGLGGYLLAGATPAEVYEAWVLSGQAFEPSVFSGFNFNSFAVKGGQAYAAGDAGIYLLGADHDAGESIQSGVRIGPVNLGSAGTKRLRGVVFGQGGTSTRVRVRTDEAEGVFAPDRDTDRVTVSRDLQASEFTVDIMNFEELGHLEIFPLRLARR